MQNKIIPHQERISGWIIYKELDNGLDPSVGSYSTRRFLEEAEKENIDLKVFTPERFNVVVKKGDRGTIYIDGEKIKTPDFVLPRMGAGTSKFIFAALRQLEQTSTFLVNKPQGIRIAQDKMETTQVLANNNLPYPETMLIELPIQAQEIERIEKIIGFPIVIKVPSGSKGEGVFLRHTKEEFSEMVDFLYAFRQKKEQKLILIEKNANKPKTMTIHLPVKEATLDRIEKSIGFNVLIKIDSEIDDASISVEPNRKQFGNLIRFLKAFSTPPLESTLILQEFVKNTVGKDLRIFVVGTDIIACMLRAADDTAIKSGEFRSNISNGGTGTPFELTDQIKHVALESARALSLSIAGVDAFLDERNSVCEVNSSPGFEGLEKATGLNVPQKIFEYIRRSLGK